MMTRRIFLKNGSARPGQPGIRAGVHRADGAGGAGAQEGARRDLPARRRGRPEHDRAVRRSRRTTRRGRRSAIPEAGPAQWQRRRRDRSRRVLRAEPADGVARAALPERRARDRARLRLARSDAVALRRAGLHGERHAGREEHARRLAQPLPARQGTREGEPVPRGRARAATAAHAAGHGAGARHRSAQSVRRPRRRRDGHDGLRLRSAVRAGRRFAAASDRQGSLRRRQDAQGHGPGEATCRPTAPSIRARASARRCVRSRCWSRATSVSKSRSPKSAAGTRTSSSRIG